MRNCATSRAAASRRSPHTDSERLSRVKLPLRWLRAVADRTLGGSCRLRAPCGMARARLLRTPAADIAHSAEAQAVKLHSTSSAAVAASSTAGGALELRTYMRALWLYWPPVLHRRAALHASVNTQTVFLTSAKQLHPRASHTVTLYGKTIASHVFTRQARRHTIAQACCSSEHDEHD